MQLYNTLSCLHISFTNFHYHTNTKRVYITDQRQDSQDEDLPKCHSYMSGVRVVFKGRWFFAFFYIISWLWLVVWCCLLIGRLVKSLLKQLWFLYILSLSLSLPFSVSFFPCICSFSFSFSISPHTDKDFHLDQFHRTKTHLWHRDKDSLSKHLITQPATHDPDAWSFSAQPPHTWYENWY